MDRISLNRIVLKLARVASEKRQAALAREIGRSPAWLSRVESGDPGSTVTDRDVYRLSAVLGVDRADLEGE